MSVLSVSTSTIHFTPVVSGETTTTIAHRVNQEWEEYADQAPPWPCSAPTMAMLLQSIRFNPDLVLGELITICQQGNPLAGRVIVQALLPKAILISSSNPYPPVEHILSALWIRIAHYRLDRRPRAVAANLILDARKDAIAECRTRVVAPPDHHEGQDHQKVVDIITAARRLGLATSQSLTIVEKVYVDGLPSAHVGKLFDMSPAAVRRRCSDTVRRLRDNRDSFVELLAA